MDQKPAILALIVVPKTQMHAGENSDESVREGKVIEEDWKRR